VTDWDGMVHQHGPMVFGTAWRILGHTADTEDVVQEVFLEAYRLRAAEAVRCWPALLRRLATCRALDRLRHRRAALPQREATVFCLRYFEDLPNQRIAEILSIQPGTVGVALHKARARLEALLTEAPTGD